MTCPDPQQLPVWLEYIKALSTPIAAFIAAGITAYFSRHQKRIAEQQMQTAKKKLELDLFDKRYALYQTISTAITTVLNIDHHKQERVDPDLSEFVRAVAEAEWLINEDMKNYLSDVLQKRIFAYLECCRQLKAATVAAEIVYGDDKKRQELDNQWKDHRTWLVRQHEELPSRFKDVMKIER